MKKKILVVILLVAGAVIVSKVNIPKEKIPLAKKSSSLDSNLQSGGTAKKAHRTETRKKTVTAGTLRRYLYNPTLDLDFKLQRIADLSPGVSANDLSSLMQVIVEGPPEGTPLAEWHQIVDTLLSCLSDSQFQWAFFGQEVARIMNDTQIDPFIRSLAAKRLTLWLGHPQSHYPSDALEDGIESFVSLFSNPSAKEDPVTGTALLLLCDLRSSLGRKSFDPHMNKIEPLVCDLVTQKNRSSLALQLAAIEAAGRLDARTALTEIRKFSRNSDTEASIRLNSLHALGYFGEPDDIAYLESLSQSKSSLRFAAYTALKNFVQESTRY